MTFGILTFMVQEDFIGILTFVVKEDFGILTFMVKEDFWNTDIYGER